MEFKSPPIIFYTLQLPTGFCTLRHLVSFTDVVNELTAIANRYKCEDAVEWFRKVNSIRLIFKINEKKPSQIYLIFAWQALEYNLSLTNTKNGLITVLTYKNLVNGDALIPEKIRLAHILGCCVELVSKYFQTNIFFVWFFYEAFTTSLFFSCIVYYLLPMI